MFANSYSPVGFFDSHPHPHPHPQPRLSPGGGGGGPGASSSSSSYEERKRREDAHRRRRIEAERSLRRRRREDCCGQFFLAASHSLPSLLFDAECYATEQHPPQSQSQPTMRFGENEVEKDEDVAASASRQRRQREMVLQSWPRLDDDNNEEKGWEDDELQRCHCSELTAQRRKHEEGSFNFNKEQEEEQADNNFDTSLSFFSDDFPPSIIYASVSMSQDEMNAVDYNNNIATTTTTTTTTDYAAHSKNGGNDSFFVAHPKEQDEKLNKGCVLVKTVNRNEQEERAVHPKIFMDIDNNEDNDALSCPPHIIAENGEEEDEDEDASNHDKDEVDASNFNSFWRGTTTGCNTQRASFRP